MHLTLWYIVLVCHQNDICKQIIDSVYVGGYGYLSETGLCVFRKLCPFGFLAVSKCLSVWLQTIVMSYIECGEDGYVV